jgi:hypothetical protein
MASSDPPRLEKSAKAMFPTRPSISGIFIDMSSMWKLASFAASVTEMESAYRPACYAQHVMGTRGRLLGSNSLPNRDGFFNRAVLELPSPQCARRFRLLHDFCG